MNTRAFWKILRNATAAELEYRTNYLILIFSTWITLVMELAVYQQIYSHREQVGSLPKSHVVSFVFMGMLVRYASQLWTATSDAISEIRDGSFRKYLLQPLHYETYFFARAIGPKITTWVLMLLSVLAVHSFSNFQVLLPFATWAPFFVALFFSILLTWQVYLAFVYLGFWIEEATFLTVAFNIGISLFSGTLLPLDWLPTFFQKALSFTPFPLMGDFPLRTALNLIPPDEYRHYLLSAFLWTFFFLGFHRFLYIQGTRRYEAYGG